MKKNITQFLGIITIISCINIHQTIAQILAPDLICVTNDTLRWEIPNNTCGSFNAYRILGSQTEAGPYQEIATITDQFETSFFHQEAGTDTWYYYMETDADCLGHPTLQSDTLDSLIPIAPSISYVSVNGDIIEVEWTPSPSPEVFAYVISKETPLGTRIIDTIYTGTSYFDYNGLPDEQSETYFVTSIDQCGNTSLVVNPHHTIFLQNQNNSRCDRSIALFWNAYQNWDNGVEKYNIYLSIDGGDFNLVANTDGNTINYTYENINENSIYCFYIEAVENGTGITSKSNQMCTAVDIIPPVIGLALGNVKIVSEDEVQLSWVWDINSSLTQTTIQYWQEMDDVIYTEDYPVSLPLTNSNSHILPYNGFNSGPTFYQISATDSCGVSVLSNPIGLIFLSGVSAGNDLNRLQWTPYVNELLDTVYYDLYRLATNVPEKIATLNSDEAFKFEDIIDSSDPSQLESCYYVVARGFITLPDGTTLETSSFSNTICLFQDAGMFIPNVFAPNGVNQKFKPILQFGNPLSYSMIIYDRWGGAVFESSNIGIGWDGKKKGRPMPQGVYIYHIKMIKDSGELVEKTGTVTLMK